MPTHRRSRHRDRRKARYRARAEGAGPPLTGRGSHPLDDIPNFMRTIAPLTPFGPALPGRTARTILLGLGVSAVSASWPASTRRDERLLRPPTEKCACVKPAERWTRPRTRRCAHATCPTARLTRTKVLASPTLPELLGDDPDPRPARGERCPRRCTSTSPPSPRICAKASMRSSSSS